MRSARRRLWENGNPQTVHAARVDASGSLLAGPMRVDEGGHPQVALADGRIGVIYHSEDPVLQDCGCTPGGYRLSPAASGFLVASTA